jgi:hypothetical protein
MTLPLYQSRLLPKAGDRDYHIRDGTAEDETTPYTSDELNVQVTTDLTSFVETTLRDGEPLCMGAFNRNHEVELPSGWPAKLRVFSFRELHLRLTFHFGALA